MVALMATLAVVALVLQTAPVAAQSMCMGPGFYHLSCYKATVTPAQAEAAKKQCLAAVSPPECAATIKKSGAGMVDCDTYIVYSFATQACRDAYQSAEKTNPACTLYASSGLGKPENRDTPNSAADFACT
ncbi:uncharacterized protein HaLaN_24178 [Haematococcus lacustris]|uniref:Uncharacterized protein n=1 Tax=Haematococcus lacustris TaxID=44745 RepID=A0A699ZUI7_HAELA|nr:uncharacterized protein HaLaN_24178 [Haematococcus lacustris]